MTSNSKGSRKLSQLRFQDKLNRQLNLPHCPDCGETTEVTRWLPPQGVAPHLREFRCPRCGAFFYKIATEGLIELLRLVH